MAKMTHVEMQEMIDKLLADNAALKASGQRKLTLKVSEKGAVSLYGLRRFPVTFYVEEWNKILGETDSIRAFMTANDTSLTRKIR